MVKMVVMTVWIQRVQGGEKVKDQDVNEAHSKNEGVYSKCGVLHVRIFIITIATPFTGCFTMKTNKILRFNSTW